MNKKGDDMLKETLEIILFAVAVALLVFAVVKIYKITLGQELEDAKTIINLVETRVDAIESGESGKFAVRGLEGWFLGGWSKNEDKPGKCVLDSCICVCKGDAEKVKNEFTRSSDVQGQEMLREVCQENSICRKVKTNQVIVGEVYSFPIYKTVTSSSAAGGIPVIDKYEEIIVPLISLEERGKLSEIHVFKNEELTVLSDSGDLLDRFISEEFVSGDIV